MVDIQKRSPRFREIGYRLANKAIGQYRLALLGRNDEIVETVDPTVDSYLKRIYWGWSNTFEHI